MENTDGKSENRMKKTADDPAYQAIYDKLSGIDHPTGEDYKQAVREILTEENKRFFIAGKTEYSLTRILPLASTGRLRELAGIYNIENRESLDTAALIERLIPAMKDPERLEIVLYILPVDTWEMFVGLLLEEKCITDNNVPAEKYKSLLVFGYITLFYDDGNFNYVLPDEIRETFESLDEDKVFEMREFIESLDQYAKAAVHLYGVINLPDFCDLFNEYECYDEDSIIKPEEAVSRLKTLSRLEGDYFIFDDYIAAPDFVKRNGRLKRDDIHTLEAIRKDKPCYIPGADVFLRYADPDYYPETSEIVKLKKSLKREGITENKIEDIVNCFHYSMAAEEEIEAAIGNLKKIDAELEPVQLNHLMADIKAMHGSTKIWSNNGYSPDEMRRMTGSTSLTGEAARVKAGKTGRNDPCPCGSGKKYKKCCGK